MSVRLKQIIVDSDFDMMNFKIVNVGDPINDADAVNLQTLKTMISGSTAVTSMADLTDVDLNNLSDYDILMLSGGTWVNSKDIILPDDAKIYIGNWRISELTGDLKIEKKVSGKWELGAEFFI